MNTSRHRLVMVSGPSCSGKTPLKHALRREFPALAETFQQPVPYTSRAPRPGEKDGQDYHFRGREQLEELRGDSRYLVLQVRDDLQAVDMDEMRSVLRDTDAFYEGNEHVALALKRRLLEYADVLDVFLSPLSLAEVQALADESIPLRDVVTDLMRRRLTRRALNQKQVLTPTKIEDIETRARHAYHALAHAHEFSHVIPNHDGEDSDNWSAFPRTIGDARRSLLALAALLGGERSPLIESWPEGAIELGPNPVDCSL